MTTNEFLAFLIVWSGPGLLGMLAGVVGRKIMDYTGRRKPDARLQLTPLVLLIGAIVGALFGPIAALAGVLALGVGLITLVLSPKFWTEPIGRNGKHIPK